MFKFTPKLNQESRNIIENRVQLKELVNCYGSPLNILFTNVMMVVYVIKPYIMM